MENTYKEGQEVRERIRPSQKLIVKRYAFDIYYCQPAENKNVKELVYLERDLMPINSSRR